MLRKLTTRSALLVVATLVLATPVMASLVVQNFMQADVTTATACFFKIAGDDAATYTGTDADDPLVTFDATQTVQVDGANLIEETIGVRGMTGDRVVYTDVVRYQNNCDVPLDVSLVADSSIATGDWTDRSVRIYLSTDSDVVGASDAAEVAPTGLPGDVGSGWDATPIVVDVGGNISQTSTGTVTLAPGQELRGAMVISTGTGVGAGVGTVNWTARAFNSNDN